MTATLHEQVVALMKDGESRTVSEVITALERSRNSVYPILAALASEDSLKVVRDPVTQLRVYVWADA